MHHNKPATGNMVVSKTRFMTCCLKLSAGPRDNQALTTFLHRAHGGSSSVLAFSFHEISYLVSHAFSFSLVFPNNHPKSLHLLWAYHMSDAANNMHALSP
jgi:hypothetical protein